MNLELSCLARILGRSWRKGKASRQVSKLQGYGDLDTTRISEARLEVSKQLEAGLERSRGASAMEIQKMVEIKGPFFCLNKVRKKQARNKGVPSSRLQLQMWLALNLKFPRA